MANETVYFEIQVKNLDDLLKVTGTLKAMTADLKVVAKSYKDLYEQQKTSIANLANLEDTALNRSIIRSDNRRRNKEANSKAEIATARATAIAEESAAKQASLAQITASKLAKDQVIKDNVAKTKSTQDFGISLNKVSGILTTFGVALGVTGVTDFARSIFDAQSKVEALKLTLGNLLGNVSGKSLFAQFQQFTTETPFTFEETIKGVNQLVGSMKAVGLSSQVISRDVIPTLRSLGNSASALGGGDKLERLTYAFTQVQAAGRLMGTEVRQIAETGFPLMAILADNLGIKVSELQERIHNGQVGFSEFKKAILDAGNAGGVFADSMTILATTVKGKMDILKDNIFFAKAAIGDNFSAMAKSIVDATNNIVTALFGTENAVNRTVAVFSGLVQGLLAWKTIMNAAAIIQGIIAAKQAIVNSVVATGTIIRNLYNGTYTVGMLIQGRKVLLDTKETTGMAQMGAVMLANVAAKEALVAAEAELILAQNALGVAMLKGNAIEIDAAIITAADAKTKVGLTADTVALTVANQAAATSFRTLNLAMGVIGIAITAAFVAYQYFNAEQKEAIKLHSEEGRQLEESRAQITAQVGLIKDLAYNTKARNVQLEILKNKYPEYFGLIDIENTKNEQLERILKSVNKAFDLRIELSDIAYKSDLQLKRRGGYLDDEAEALKRVNEENGKNLSLQQRVLEARRKVASTTGEKITSAEADLLASQKNLSISAINLQRYAQMTQETNDKQTKSLLDNALIQKNINLENAKGLKDKMRIEKEYTEYIKGIQGTAGDNIKAGAGGGAGKGAKEFKPSKELENRRKEIELLKELGQEGLRDKLDLLEKEREAEILEANERYGKKAEVFLKTTKLLEKYAIKENKLVEEASKENLKTIEQADKERIKLLKELEVAKKAIVEDAEEANLDLMKASELAKAESEEEKYQISVKYDKLEYDLKRKRLLAEIQNNSDEITSLQYSVEFKKQKAADNIKLILKEGKDREDAIKISNEAIDKENESAILKIELDTQKHYGKLVELDGKYQVKKLENTTKNNDRIKKDTKAFLDAVERIEVNNKIARLKTIENFLKGTQTALKSVATAYGNFGTASAKVNAAFVNNLIDSVGSVINSVKAARENLKLNRDAVKKLEETYAEARKNAKKGSKELEEIEKEYNKASKKLKEEHIAISAQKYGEYAKLAINVIGSAIIRQTALELDGINRQIENTKTGYDQKIAVQKKAQDDALALLQDGFDKEEKIRADAQFKKDASIEAAAAAERNKVLARASQALTTLAVNNEEAQRINKKAGDEELALRELYNESLNAKDVRRRDEAEKIVNEGVQKIREAQVEELKDLVINQAATQDIQNEINRIKIDALAEDIRIRKLYANDIASTDKAISDKAKASQASDLADLKATTKQKVDTLLVEKDETKEIVIARTDTVNSIVKEASDAIVKIDQKEKADLFNSRTTFDQVEIDAKIAKDAALLAQKEATDKANAELEYEKNYKLWQLEVSRIDAEYKLKVQELKVSQALAAVEIGIQVAIMTAKLAATSLVVGLVIAAASAVTIYALLRAIPDPPKQELPAEPIKPFYKGTDNTSENAPRRRVDNKGGFQAILHPDEQIFSKEQVDTMTRSNGGVRMTRNDVMNKIMNYDTVNLKGITPNIVNRIQNDNSKLEKEIKGLRKDLLALQGQAKIVNQVDKSGFNTYLQTRSKKINVLQNKYKQTL
jgi:tape measure domain-containing protein